MSRSILKIPFCKGKALKKLFRRHKAFKTGGGAGSAFLPFKPISHLKRLFFEGGSVRKKTVLMDSLFFIANWFFLAPHWAYPASSQEIRNRQVSGGSLNECVFQAYPENSSRQNEGKEADKPKSLRDCVRRDFPMDSCLEMAKSPRDCTLIYQPEILNIQGETRDMQLSRGESQEARRGNRASFIANQEAMRELRTKIRSCQTKLEEDIEQEKQSEWQKEYTHFTNYRACGKDKYRFYLNEEDRTEARALCAECESQAEQKSLDTEILEQTAHDLQWTEFKGRLREKIENTLSVRLAQIQFIKNCAQEGEAQEQWLNEAVLTISDFRKDKRFQDEVFQESLGQVNSSHDVQKICDAYITEIKDPLKEKWGDMRLSLVLSQGISLRSDRSGSDDEGTYRTLKPSHKIGGSVSLPPLSRGEMEKLRERWIQALLTAVKESGQLESMSLEEFERKIRSMEVFEAMIGYSMMASGQRPMQTRIRGLLGLNCRDESLIYQALQAVAEKSLKEYHDIMALEPLLAQFETANPNDGELVKALENMEKPLKRMLKKISQPSAPDSLLLSFNDLVEGLLAESAPDESSDSPYCAVVERQKINAERDKEFNEDLLSYSMWLAVVPCFFGGPLAWAACLGGAFSLEAYSVSKDYEEAKDSLAHQMRQNPLIASPPNSCKTDDERDSDECYDVVFNAETAADRYRRANEDYRLAIMFAPILMLDLVGLSKAAGVTARHLRRSNGSEDPPASAGSSFGGRTSRQ